MMSLIALGCLKDTHEISGPKKNVGTLESKPKCCDYPDQHAGLAPSPF